MTWDEVDLHAKVWTVPASRMKAKVTHRVPLSERAVEILKTQREMHPDDRAGISVTARRCAQRHGVDEVPA